MTSNKKPDMSSDFTLDHVAISVSNLNRSIEFYKKNFGFSCDKVSEMPRGNGKFALLQKPGFTIETFQMSGVLPLPDYRKTTDTDLQTIGVKHFAIRVNDILGASDFLKRNGVEFLTEVSVGIRGLRRFFVKDPDGILLEISEGPSHK